MMKSENTKILRGIKMQCPCCMETHIVYEVDSKVSTIYKNMPISYIVKMFYCCNTDEYYQDEQQLTESYQTMKAAYETTLMNNK